MPAHMMMLIRTMLMSRPGGVCLYRPAELQTQAAMVWGSPKGISANSRIPILSFHIRGVASAWGPLHANQRTFHRHPELVRGVPQPDVQGGRSCPRIVLTVVYNNKSAGPTDPRLSTSQDQLPVCACRRLKFTNTGPLRAAFGRLLRGGNHGTPNTCCA